MLNIFRLVGDLLHLASFIILLRKIRANRSCAGISMKTQEMYLLVFVTRYLDIFYNLHIYSLLSVYNWVMKIIFIASTASILYLMRVRYRATYDKERDTFRVAFLIVPSALLALLWNEEFSFVEILWAFSIYLEAVAILPQIFMLHRTGEVDVLTGDYVFTLGGYRAFYLLNWIYRLLTQEGYRQWIVWVAGIVQTLVYCDFFYYYALSKWYNRKLTLPR